LVGQIEARFVKADPIHAATALSNREECKGAVVLVERGVVSFGTKATSCDSFETLDLPACPPLDDTPPSPPPTHTHY